jgi:hypothetical protein
MTVTGALVIAGFFWGTQDAVFFEPDGDLA